MARLTILMATYNGERFLKEQLASFDAQSFQDWDLWVSDDGSKDQTKEILRNFKFNSFHKLVVRDGPHEGFVKNFLDLTISCENDAEYFAFSDQDDIWNKNKLKKAIDWLNTIPSSEPALYCSRTEIVGVSGKSSVPPIYSPLMKISPCFPNALVQSIAGGNTMVFNRAAKKLLEDFGGVVSVPSHDWWLYLLVTGVGGKVYYDSTPSLRYRQHGDNLVGSNRSLKALVIRLCKFLDGRFRKFNDENLEALGKNIKLLTKTNQESYENFVLSKRNFGLKALVYFQRSKAKRQGWLFNVALWVGVLLGRI